MNACTVPDLTGYEYVKGAETAGGLDWGFSGQTSWVALMAHKDQVKVNLENRV